MAINKHILWVICISLLVLPVAVDAQQKVRLANGEWPPFQSKNLKHYGLSSKIMTEAFLEVGVDVEYGCFPWARSLSFVESGQWDASGLWAHNENRAAYAFYSQPALEFQWVFFYRKDTAFDWNNMSDLSDYTIGVVNGYDYGDNFKQALDSHLINVEYVSHDIVNFRKLLRGRIHIAAFEINNAYYLLRKEFDDEDADQLIHHSKPLTTSALHLIVSKQNKQAQNIIDLFNKGLTRLQESGRLEQYITESQRGEYLLLK